MRGLVRRCVRSFLPAGWCAAYKFTIFEDSYLVSFVEVDMQGRQTREDAALHLARYAAAHRQPPPLAGDTASGVHAHACSQGWLSSLPRFELVWPLAMDAEFIRTVDQAFYTAALRPRAAKRKGLGSPGDSASGRPPGSGADLPLEVHAKMRRLSFDP